MFKISDFKIAPSVADQRGFWRFFYFGEVDHDDVIDDITKEKY